MTADFDALGDVEVLADELRSSIEELVAAGGASGAEGLDERAQGADRPAIRTAE